MILLCVSFSEHAVFCRLMSVRPHAKVTVALKSKPLKKGVGANAENLATRQESPGVACAACPEEMLVLSENRAVPLSPLLSACQRDGAGLCAGQGCSCLPGTARGSSTGIRMGGERPG